MYSFHKTEYRNNPYAFKNGWIVPHLPNDDSAEMDAHYLGDDVLSHVLKNFSFSPCIWKHGIRARDNFLFARLCVLDVDEGMTVEEAVNLFKGKQCIIAASRNHRRIKKGRWADRFRVVLIFDNYITDRATFEHNMRYYINLYKTDQQTVDAARFYFPCKEILHVSHGDFVKTLSLPVNEINARAERREKSLKKIAKDKTPTRFMTEFDAQGAYAEGIRNSMIYRQASHMTLKGFDLPTIIEYCKGKTNLKVKEVETTCESAFKTFIRYKKT